MREVKIFPYQPRCSLAYRLFIIIMAQEEIKWKVNNLVDACVHQVMNAHGNLLMTREALDSHKAIAKLASSIWSALQLFKFIYNWMDAH